MGVVFLNLFAAIILLYAYVLMGRVEASRRTLESDSVTDALTGTLNRRALEDSAMTLFDRLNHGEPPFVVMFADLDKFKLVNDTHGHAVGDKVLKKIAEILKRAVRDSDIVARLGGDEFVLLLEAMNLDEAEIVARRIRKAVDDYATERDLPCSVSIGIGQAPDHGKSLEQVLHRVDAALYRSKGAVAAESIQRVDRVFSAVESN